MVILKAAEQGCHIAAQFNLGRRYANGRSSKGRREGSECSMRAANDLLMPNLI